MAAEDILAVAVLVVAKSLSSFVRILYSPVARSHGTLTDEGRAYLLVRGKLLEW